MAKKSTRRKTSKKTAKKPAKRAIRTEAASPASMTTEALAAELRKRQRVASSLQRKRDRLMAQLSEINAEIAALGGATSGLTPTGRARNAKKLPDALHDVLQGHELSVTEAAESVQAAGYVSSAANFRTMVNQALLKDKRFKKVRRGVYTAK